MTFNLVADPSFIGPIFARIWWTRPRWLMIATGYRLQIGEKALNAVAALSSGGTVNRDG